MKIHFVKKGESLYLIGQKYGLTVEQLLAANPGITNPDRIDVGMKLIIPDANAPGANMPKAELTAPKPAAMPAPPKQEPVAQQANPKAAPQANPQMAQQANPQMMPQLNPMAAQQMANPLPNLQAANMQANPQAKHMVNPQFMPQHSNISPFGQQYAMPNLSAAKSNVPPMPQMPVYPQSTMPASLLPGAGWGKGGQQPAVHPYAAMPVPAMPVAGAVAPWQQLHAPGAPNAHAPYNTPFTYGQYAANTPPGALAAQQAANAGWKPPHCGPAANESAAAAATAKKEVIAPAQDEKKLKTSSAGKPRAGAKKKASTLEERVARLHRQRRGKGRNK